MRYKSIFVMSVMALTPFFAEAQTTSKTPAKGTASKTTAKPAAKTSTAKTKAAASQPKKELAPAVKVQAPWRLAYNDPQLIVAVDTSQTERLPDGSYRAKLRWLYTKDQKIEDNKTYRMMVETRLLDCKKVRSKPISATVYDANGNKVSTFTTPDDELQYLLWGKRTPGSRNDNALAKSCDILSATRPKK